MLYEIIHIKMKSDRDIIFHKFEINLLLMEL